MLCTPVISGYYIRVGADVIIQVRPADRNMDRDRMVNEIAGDTGVAFEPLDPVHKEGSLGEYFQACVPEQSAQELVKVLRQRPDVRAAYVKPAGRPPR